MRKIVLTSAAALMSLAAPALAQRSVLDYRFAGLDACAATGKDAAAHDAFKLLGLRLQELEHELQLEPEAGQAIGLAWDMFSGAMALRVSLTEEQPGIALGLTSRPSGDATAASVVERLARFAQMGGVPMEQDDGGAMMFDSPAGPGSLSLVGSAGGQAAALRVGATETAPLELDSPLMPAGANTMMQMRLDLEGLSMFLLPMIERDTPEVAQMLTESGWLGEGAPVIEYAVGSSAEATLMRAKLHDVARLLSEAGAGPDVVFARDDLRGIPGDAVRLYAKPASFKTLSDMVDAIEQETGEDIFGQINRELGIDLRGDVLDNMGPRQVLYMADSTGGGGLLSSVVLLDVRDPARLARAHARFVARFNDEMRDEARGYLRIHASKRHGSEVFTLMTPGLPVPLELSWAIAEGRLVIALSPGSLDAAIAQLKSGEHSILESDSFRTAVLARLPEQGASSVTFTDTPRLARRGYGVVNLLLSGLANGLRSPEAPDRVVSPLMPAFHEFNKDVRPFGMIAYWEGDDYMLDAVGDRSMLVNMAAGAASLADMQGVAIAAVGGGVMLPALGKARESARQLKGATQVRTVIQGAIVYMGNHDDQMPASYDVLTERGIITPEMYTSPYGPVGDGKPDIALWFGLPKDRAASFDSNQIIAIDRAMLLSTGFETNVGFADAHVQRMSIWELEEYLEMPQNEGAREALGIPEL
ncbi:MAG: hypothetical protein ACIARR_09115 [Phycisphaerales bacterium JB059]